MDKPSSFMVRRPVEKRGFALIVTLSVLTVLIALTGVLISYLDTARKDAGKTEAVMQANIYFSDIKRVLERFKNRKSLYSTLYLVSVPLASEDGRFSLLLSCRPLTDGVNINWLAYADNPSMETQYGAVQKVFEALVQYYDIKDPPLLEEMLVETIRKGSFETLDEQSRLVQKNGIISYRQFKRLLSRYQFAADDQRIGEIPWDKYFVFNPVAKDPKENTIAGDYLSEELLSVLLDIDKGTLEESWSKGEGALKRIVNMYGITYDRMLYATEFSNQSRCEVSYAFNGKPFVFTFVDNKGEVKDFEFSGEQ